jgi:hypothetical protein
MNPYRLWYLADQTASGSQGIYDTKTFTGNFVDLPTAQAQAATDGIAHYSVELDRGNGIDFDIVYII